MISCFLGEDYEIIRIEKYKSSMRYGKLKLSKWLQEAHEGTLPEVGDYENFLFGNRFFGLV